MTERINRMKLVACIFYGACLGLIAGYYGVLLLFLAAVRTVSTTLTP
jgi:hypothetical protein